MESWHAEQCTPDHRVRYPLMLRPSTDSARKAMLETIVHGVVSVTVIGCSTYLASVHSIDSGAWAAAIGAGIAVSGGVSVLQGRTGNGHITEEALAQMDPQMIPSIEKEKVRADS